MTTSSDLGVAPPEKIVVIPYGFDLSGLSRPDDAERARRRADARRPDRRLRRRLGRTSDGDQAAARPRPDTRRAPARRHRCAPRRRRRWARAARAWRRWPASSAFESGAASWATSGTWGAGTGCSTPSCSRRRTRERPSSRSRRWQRLPGRGDGCGGHRDGGARRRIGLPRRRSATPTRWPPVSTTLASRPGLAPFARDWPGSHDVAERFALETMTDTVDALYRRLLDAS